MKTQNGFTLLEILIVAIVLSLIASVIMPQISQAASEAKVSGFCKSLQKVRTAIDVYKTQHKNNLPGIGDCDFIQAMTLQTNQSGLLIQGQDCSCSEVAFGPYLFDIPQNPYNGLDTVDTDGIIGDNSHGWHYDSQTGVFCDDSSANQSQL